MALFDGWLEERLQRLGYTKARRVPDVLRATASAQQYDIPGTEMAHDQAQAFIKLGAINAAVNALANACKLQTLNVKKRDGKKLVDIDNHPFELLLEQPNPAQSGVEFIYNIVANRVLTGNAYVFLNRTSEGQPPIELWPVPTHRIRPVPDANSYIRGYMYDPGDGREIPLQPWEIMHLKGFHPLNQLVGASAIESIAWEIKGDSATAQWLANRWKDDSVHFPGILMFGGVVSDEEWERINRDFKAQNGGTRRNLRMLRSTDQLNGSWLSTKMDEEDRQLLESRVFNREEIFRVLAPGLESMLNPSATEANAVAGKKVFMEEAVWPMLVDMAAKITADILPTYGPSLIAEFDDPRITDRALKLREQEVAQSSHTIDEIREMFYEDEPLGDDRGKLLIAQIGQAMITPDGSERAPAPSPFTPDNAQSENEPGKEDEPEPDNDVDAMRAKELTTWRRYAGKHGATKAAEFSPDVLPADVASVIKSRLAAATSDEEVHAAFSGPFLVKAERITTGGLVDPNAEAKELYERRLRRLLKSRLGGQLDEVMRLLGDPPDISKLDAAFWASATGRMIADLRPQMERMAQDAGERLFVSGIGADWTLVAEAAADWASAYSNELVSGITDTTRRVLQKNVERYIREPGTTLGDLKQSLEPYFGETRADMIAVTEVTRAFAQGEMEMAKIAGAVGIRLEPVWHTNRDELVCSVCAPNDGKMRSQGWTVQGPPAHPRCRCWITHRPAK